MIVDTSAIFAIVLAEPERERFAAALAADPMPSMSAGIWIELAAVGTRRFGASNFELLYRFVTEAGIVIAPVTVTQARIAHDAYRTYGIGSSHPAALDFGDCFSYALARESGEPLLFKGDGFARTDIVSAI